MMTTYRGVFGRLCRERGGRGMENEGKRYSGVEMKTAVKEYTVREEETLKEENRNH